jgi:hypothetical protein
MGNNRGWILAAGRFISGTGSYILFFSQTCSNGFQGIYTNHRERTNMERGFQAIKTVVKKNETLTDLPAENKRLRLAETDQSEHMNKP